MYLTKVIPLAKLPLDAPEIFSYFTSKEILPGGIVLVPFKKRLVFGVVLGQEKVIDQKQNIKKGGIILKPIKKVIFPFPFLNQVQIKLAFFLAKYYLVHSSRFFSLFLPEIILKKIKDFKGVSFESPLPFKKKVEKKLYLAPSFFFPEEDLKDHLKMGGQILFIFPTKNQLRFWKRKFLSLKVKEKDIVFFSPKLPSKKIFEVFQKTISGKAKIVLGQRSSLFLPFLNLSLICLVDAENKNYSSKREPYFDAKTVAQKLSEFSGSTLIFTSPFCSLESYLYFKNKKEIQAPQVPWEILDLRKLKTPLNQEFLSRVQKSALTGKKVLILLRKKESGIIFCPDCKWIKNCPKCFLPMRVKIAERKIICPKCKIRQNVPKKCEICLNWNLKLIGGEEERLQEKLKEILPKGKMFVQNKKIEKMNKFFRKGGVLLWRTNIFEFLPFKKDEKFDLAFVFNLDFLFNLPYFNVEERVFEILQKLLFLVKEKIIVQTNFKELFEIFFQKKEALFEKWKAERQKMQYPPFRELVLIQICEKKKTKLLKTEIKLQKALEELKRKFEFEILGPKPTKLTSKGYLSELLLKIKPNDISLKEKLRSILPPESKVKVNPREI